MDTVDEFAGCTLEDCALAIAYNPPGSEDQLAAIAAFHRRAPSPEPASPGIGHNAPPLGEIIDEELEPWIAEHDALIAAANAAKITDDDSAGRVLDLLQKMKVYEQDLDKIRQVRTSPHREAERLINGRYNRMIMDVAVARQGTSGKDGLRGQLKAWDDRKKAAAAEAKAKAEREQRAKEIAAKEARKTLEEAQRTGQGVAAAEVAAHRAEGQAAAAATHTERAGRAAPTRGNLGAASRRKEIVFEIVDEPECYLAMRSNPLLAPKVTEALRNILRQHLRSVGVEHADKVNIRGVRVQVEEGDIYVRR